MVALYNFQLKARKENKGINKENRYSGGRTTITKNHKKKKEK